MSRIEEEGLSVTLNIETVENVTVAYLKEVYSLLQKNIGEFIQHRIVGTTKPTTLIEWEEYNDWHIESDRIRKVLILIMDQNEYNDFMTKTYKKCYKYVA